MADRQYYLSLIKWLQTFDIEASHATIEEISDGVAMAQALNQIDPEWFDSRWMSKIKTGVGLSWRLKVSNLKKIIEGIVDYYQDSLNLHADFVRPDAVKIGEKNDPVELARLLQLILGCAVNCNKKQEYIKRIMDMEESLQQVIMQSIQELESNGAGAFSVATNLSEGFLSTGLQPAILDPQIPKLLQELEAASNARDWMAQKCHELEMQVTLLQEEKSCIVLENQNLKEKVKEHVNLEHTNLLDPKDTSNGSGQKYKELRKQLENCKEEMYKMEQSRDDYKAKVSVLEKELLELQAKQEELVAGAEEARHLKDEMDILRETAEKVARHEALIESYKKKLEEYGDLKRQVKLLEDKNTDYMQQNMDLEEEIKKIGTWKPQVEVYKKKNAELQQKFSEESKKADKAEFENKKLQEKLQYLQREKERLIIERDSLKEVNDELKCTQLQMNKQKCGSVVDTPETITEAESVEIIPPKIKEKILRLQHEIKMLKMNQRGSDEVPALKAMVEDMDQHLKTLQTENRVAHQRILELESQLDELKDQSEHKIDERTASSTQGIKQLEKQLKLLQDELDKKMAELEEKDSTITELNQKTATLQENLHWKEEHMVALEEKYQRCVKKAQSIAKAMDPKETPGSVAEVSALQNQLAEKEKIIENYKREIERNKAIKEREEKFITAAFHAQSLELHRSSVDQRLSKFSKTSSCLSRQRQATSRRIPQTYSSEMHYEHQHMLPAHSQ